MELLIEDKKTNKILNISEIAKDVSYTSKMRNGASKLTFSYINNGFTFDNGSVVKFKYNGTNIFYGYIFKCERNKEDLIQVLAYDQLRYLKAKDTLIRSDVTLSQLLMKICDNFKLKYGVIEDSKYILSNKTLDNKTLLDMCYEAMDETFISTSNKYILYDDFGEITLKDAKGLRIPIIIGDKSMAYDYGYSLSIDDETYNQVKLAMDNKETGTRENYIVQDSNSIAKWGILQYYDKTNEKVNDAQIKQKAKDLLKLYNREKESLSISALGDVRVIGGTGIFVKLEDLNINQWFMVEEATHDFKKDIHTMKLELII